MTQHTEPSALDEILNDMELVISSAQLIDNTPIEAGIVRAELCEAMRELIRRAWLAALDD